MTQVRAKGLAADANDTTVAAPERQATPGPWVVVKDDDVSIRRPFSIRGDEHELIAVGIWDEHMEGEPIANAHLMSAAPELLEALVSHVDYPVVLMLPQNYLVDTHLAS